jgi:hypothetical protein
MQAPLLLAVFSACPKRLVPFLYALADLGTALAFVGSARAKNAKSSTSSLQPWWIALLYISLYLTRGITSADVLPTESSLIRLEPSPRSRNQLHPFRTWPSQSQSMEHLQVCIHQMCQAQVIC